MKYNFVVGKHYECNDRVKGTRFFTVTERTIFDAAITVTVQFEDTKEIVTGRVIKDAFKNCEKLRLLVNDLTTGHFVTAFADNAEDVDPTADWTWRERVEAGDDDPEYWANQDAVLNGDFA
jgi:hypothetical protein